MNSEENTALQPEEKNPKQNETAQELAPPDIAMEKKKLTVETPQLLSIQELIKDGLLDKNSWTNEELRQAASILEKNKPENLDFNDSNRQEQVSKEVLHRIAQTTIDNFKKYQVLPEFLLDAMQKRLTVDNVELGTDSGHDNEFKAGTIGFRGKSELGLEINIGDIPDKIYLNRCPQHEQVLQEALGKKGISLSQEKLVDLSLQIIAAHELGHAAHRAIARLLENVRSQQEVISINTMPSSADPNDEIDKHYKAVQETIYKDFPLPQPLADLLASHYNLDDPDQAACLYATSEERIARAIEEIYTSQAISELGIDPHITKQIMINEETPHQKLVHTVEFIGIAYLSETIGLKVPKLKSRLSDLKKALGPRFVLADKKTHPAIATESQMELLDYREENIGYDYGLTQEQMLKLWKKIFPDHN